MDISNAQRARVLVHALPYIQDYSGKIVVVKYGGNAMVSEHLKDSVIRDICLLQLIGVKVVLVHGGGPELTQPLGKMGKKSAFVDGVRVTDEEAVGVALMVLAGKINKTLVNLIELKGGSAIGLSGLDGHMLKATVKKPELGYVGEITDVNVQPILDVIDKGYIPVVSTVGYDDAGNIYNINADTAAARRAGALGAAAPRVWLGRAAADGSLADLGLTLLWTVLPFVLAYVLLNRSFIRIVTTRRGQVKVRYEKKAMRASSQDAALYRRELARLTSSSGYMLNAGLGLVFELVLAVLAVVKRRELLGALTAIPELYAAAAPILLLACMMVSSMVFFTASSVSLEGKSYWIVRSMPVETKKVLQAKLSLSNSLAIAPALLMTLAAALALRLPAAETALLLACQLLFVLLTANVGLMEDLRHCNLDWINETQAAKQGAGVLLSMLLGFGFVVAVGALYFFLLAELMPTTAFLGLILALMAILYALTARWLMTRGVKRFETLR